MSDGVREQLAQLSIPQPSGDAVQQILYAARQEPVRGLSGALAPLRRMRAILFLPRVRMGVMASVLAGLIGLGTLREAPQPVMLQPQVSQVVAAAESSLPELGYFDEALEQEEPLQDFWITASLTQ
jgi:hypothetical protein